MKIKIVNNLMNEDIFPLKFSTLRQDKVVFGDKQLMSKHTHFTPKVLQYDCFCDMGPFIN